jgi:hypothetical protein
MPKYAVYARTHTGHVKRVRNFSSNYPHDLLKRHFHQGSLTGFPENTVFWINPEGPSIGFAPRLEVQKTAD